MVVAPDGGVVWSWQRRMVCRHLPAVRRSLHRKLCRFEIKHGDLYRPLFDCFFEEGQKVPYRPTVHVPIDLHGVVSTPINVVGCVNRSDRPFWEDEERVPVGLLPRDDRMD